MKAKYTVMKWTVLLLFTLIAWTCANEDTLRDFYVGNIEFEDLHSVHKRSVVNAARGNVNSAARNFVGNLGQAGSLGKSGNTDLVNSCLRPTPRPRPVPVPYPWPYPWYARGNQQSGGPISHAQPSRIRRQAAGSPGTSRAQIESPISIIFPRPTILPPPPKPKTLKNRDFVFVLDTSGSIPSSQFEIAKTAISILVEYLCPKEFGHRITSHGTKQVSVVLFGRTQTTEISFRDSTHGLGSLQDKILGMRHRSEGSTATPAALKYVRQHVLGKGFSRLHNRQVSTDVIVITDGQCNVDCQTLGTEADKIRKLGHGVNLFALGVANARNCELEIITGRGSNVAFGLSDFNNLERFANAIKTLAQSSDRLCV